MTDGTGDEIENHLSDEQMEQLARRVVKIVMTNMYAEIGQSVVKKVYWFIGVIFVGAWVILSGPNWWSALTLEKPHP